MQPNKASEKEFGPIRNFLWPIHHHELKKLIPMFALFFLISFSYNLLRCMKISLIVTAEGSSASVIPFLKTGAVLPGAILMTLLFTKLISRFSREQVFYTFLVGFLIYFAIFMIFLYPNHEYLRLDSFANFIESYSSKDGARGLIAMVRHMNLTVFYVICEMWSAVVLSLLFWGFANEVTKVHEAKRFYAIFALGANMSGIFSGIVARYIRDLPTNEYIPYTSGEQWIFYQLVSVLVIGAIIISLFYWLNKSVFHMENVESLQIPKKSSKLSMRECFAYLSQSRYLLYIVVIMVSYNIVYNLADVMWTEQVKLVHVDKDSINQYMNTVTMATGVIAVFFAFIVSGNVIRYYGWTIAALITPLIWLITSIGVISGWILPNIGFMDIFNTLISNPANFILLMGTIQICLGRSCKYTVFDETKEIAFIPLPKENQRKGKAIVDGLASRFGKSGGSLIYIGLFALCGDIANTVPYVSAIIMIAISLWIFAVVRLGTCIKTGNTDIEHPHESTSNIDSDNQKNHEIGDAVAAR